MVTGEERLPAGPDDGYPGPVVVAAAIAAVAFPLISLIAALLLRSGQRNERRRAQLLTWAWASGALIVVWVVVAIGLVAVGGGSGVDEGAVVTVVP